MLGGFELWLHHSFRSYPFLAMGFTGVLCIAVPIVLLIVFKNRFQVKAAPFFFGAITFIIFALVLESFAHEYFLSGTTALSRAILNNPLLYAVYGGLTAGIFEEFGRFFCMMTVMKRFMYQREKFYYLWYRPWRHWSRHSRFFYNASKSHDCHCSERLRQCRSLRQSVRQSGSSRQRYFPAEYINWHTGFTYILSGIERRAALDPADRFIQFLFISCCAAKNMPIFLFL